MLSNWFRVDSLRMQISCERRFAEWLDRGAPGRRGTFYADRMEKAVFGQEYARCLAGHPQSPYIEGLRSSCGLRH